MNTNNNLNSQINSNVLDLETLQKQFNTTLQNYSNTYTNYLNSLPTFSGNGLVNKGYDVSNVEYIYLQGKMFMDTSGQVISITDLSGSDISGCQAVCQSLSNCTGASFDSNNGKCIAYSGNYTLSNGGPNTDSYTAIIPLSTQLLMQLKNYNAQLTNLNNQILSTLKNTQPFLNEEIEINENAEEIYKYSNKHDILKAEEIEIDVLLKEQDTHIQDKNDTYKLANSYYTQYKISIFIIIILIVLSLVIFSGVKSKLFIITLILSMFFIFKFNILYIILALVLFKLYKLNVQNKVTKMPFPTKNSN
jgi:hypothetical protein